MGGGGAVVVDSDEEDLAGEADEGGRVVLALYLVDSGGGGLVVLEFDDEGGFLGGGYRDEHHVGEALAGRELAENLVGGDGGVVGEAYGAGHRVLVVVLEDGGGFESVLVEGLGDVVGVEVDSLVEEVEGVLDGVGDLVSAGASDSVSEFACDFGVWDADRARHRVVGEVAEVYEEGEDVVGRPDALHIVAEGGDFDSDGLAVEHTDNLLLNVVGIDLDVVVDSRVGGGVSPEAVVVALANRVDDGVRVEHRAFVANDIAVVCVAHQFEVHIVSLAEGLDFGPGEAVEFSSLAWVDDAVLDEVVEGGLRLGLDDREDAGHIDEAEDSAAEVGLEHSAEEVDVFILRLLVDVSDEHIPFVDDEDEAV